MTERYIRCPQCGLPHDPDAVVCEACGVELVVLKKPPSLRPAGKPVSPVPPKPSTPTPPDAPAVGPLSGMLVDRKYRLLRALGQGAVGTVYEAEHTALGRRVAIKVLHPMHQRSPEALARFHLEARAASSIGHPNICEVYDLGRLPDDSPYMVMELLHGRTLAERIRRDGALGFKDAAVALTEILSALAGAHEKGIIHRDIKPENVFLAERPSMASMVKLLDFGIVKVQDADDSLALTRTGAVMGTPFYMAPEQARGEPIDHRVDLYACGVVLYEALTGRRPFSASNYHALMQQIIHVEPRNPLELRPDLPLGFLPIVERAMRKTPAERYPTAAAFLRDLQAQLRHLDPSGGTMFIADPGSGDSDGQPESLRIPVTFDQFPEAPSRATPAEEDDGSDTVVEQFPGELGRR